ncbi:MAG: DUF5362 family protein [Paludibacteraceae bacterium]|nr:DUF5362 family protein [Paludibacteraceae bacterium]
MEETTLVITEAGKKDLLTTAKWSKFYAVLSFIGVVFCVLMGALMLVSGYFMGNLQPELSAAMLAPLGLVYIVLGGILVMPALYLLQFAKKSEQAIADTNTEMMEQALNRMKSYWKFMGIFTIVMLAVSLLMVPVAVIGSFLL